MRKKRKGGGPLNEADGEAVRKVLRQGPASWVELVKRTGIPMRSVYRWLARLGATRKVGDSRWTLP